MYHACVVDLTLEIAAVTLTVLACGWAWVTVAAEIPLPHWPLRMWDFPRLQALMLAAVTLVLYLPVAAAHEGLSWWEWIVPVAMALVILRQTRWVWPYTAWSKEDVTMSDAKPGADDALSIIISNVLQSNEQYQQWRDVLGDMDVDIIACAETDQRWIDEIDQALGESHPHKLLEPRDNMYGMAIWSRLELVDTKVEHVVQDDIPSMHGAVVLRNGKRVHFHCLHPRPPAPQENDSSAPRDAELIIVARRIAKRRKKQGDRSTVVMGDLNDVAWSRTTRLFQEVSGLLDPRRGRGLYNSFHAQHLWCRFPLDHVFISPDFRLIEMQRLGDVGSDHYPMLVRIALDPEAEAHQQGPTADRDDLEDAQDKVDEQAKREANGDEEGHVTANEEAGESDVADEIKDEK